jgi:adenine phosphoribosyltransferase
MKDVRQRIVMVPDFPVAGTSFRDITPALSDAACLRHAVDILTRWAAGRSPDIVAAVDARGFILGGALAVSLGCGFVPLRKEGKLPRERIRREFDGEYASDVLELHRDAFRPGARVLVHDDVLATGHCAEAVAAMIEELGGEVVGLTFLTELAYLHGRSRVEPYEVCAVTTFD